MKKYAILVFKDTGVAGVAQAFVDEQIPSLNLLPPDKDLVEFDETHPDFDLLYALTIDDTAGVGAEYLAPIQGGVKYNFDTQRFEFTKDTPPDVFEIARNTRNQMIRETDDLMLVPDMPQSLKDQLVTYRQALRDVTNNLTADTNPANIVWPERPHFI